MSPPHQGGGPRYRRAPLRGPQRADEKGFPGLARATNPDYRSCSTETDCLDRDALAVQFRAFGKIIPNLHWKIKDLWVAGDRIMVLGEATGTPTEIFFGVEPTGRSFTTISLDTFVVKNGKLSSAYHVENWVAAIRQVKGE